MTLIELLVVVSILLLLVLVAIPAVRPGLENQRLREAARMVNVILGNARNRAEESGRPYGVEFDRPDLQPFTSVRLFQVEVPPPYGGDTTGAVVSLADATYVITGWAPNLNPPPAYVPQFGLPRKLGFRVLKVLGMAPSFSSGLVRRGDRIQFNYQGPIYTIDFDRTPWLDPPMPPQPTPAAIPDFPLDARQFIDFAASGGPYVLTVVAPLQDAPSTPWGYGTPPVPSSMVPCTIFRQPVRTAVAPVQLPRGTAIDLAYSGTTSNPSAGARDSDTVRILFSPNGAVDRVYGLYCGGKRCAEPIYLLVGRRDRVSLDPPAPFSSPAEDGLTNLQDLNNFWIAVQSQTGLTTTDNVADNPGPTPRNVTATDAAITAARASATPGQAVGGR